jgi:exodeoxyribonuclease-5
MTLTLSDDQAQAVKHVTDRDNWRNGHYWLAGYAGSGKTSIAPFIIDGMAAKKPLFVAPTNKAAKVLAGKIGRHVTSIHKAIYYPPGENPNGSLEWTLNHDGPASQADLIICDEASMVGTRLGEDLASFGKPIIAIGDPGQLPPVNDDPYFCVGKPDFILTKIHRQAEGNPIIALSRDIREGKRLSPGKMGDAVTIARAGAVSIDLDRLPQIIVGTHRRRWSVTYTIRDLMERVGSWLPLPGEPLISRKNARFINGQELTANEFTVAAEDAQLDAHVTDDDGKPAVVKAWRGPFKEHDRGSHMRPTQYDADWQAQRGHGVEVFDFGYAITCHVSQGSQWPDVLVYDESRVFRDDARKWLYTAVTRAAERLTVIV